MEQAIQNPYTTDNAKLLEESILSQAAGKSKYKFEANKALLKYYQATPENANLDIAASILLLSLVELPSTHYLALSYLVSPKFWSNKNISKIKEAADFLEKAQYAEFWEVYNQNSETFASVKGFADS